MAAPRKKKTPVKKDLVSMRELTEIFELPIEDIRKLEKLRERLIDLSGRKAKGSHSKLLFIEREDLNKYLDEMRVGTGTAA